MISNQLTSSRLRRLSDSRRHFPAFSWFTHQPATDTYDLIQKDFMLTKPVSQCIEGSEKQNNLKIYYESLVSDNPDFSAVASPYNDVLEMSADVDSCARGIIFGTCIAASFAIKNQTNQSTIMRQVMLLLLNEAMLLRNYFVAYSNTVKIQPNAYNVVLNLIRAIIDNTISTSELIFQANRDCSIDLVTPPSQVNRIFADLVYFVLYKATRHLGSTYYCLATKAPLTTIERNYICSYLGIKCQTLLIDSHDASLDLIVEGRNDVPISHTIVIAHEKTRLLLDTNMQRQLACEKKDRGSFGDPEIRFGSRDEYIPPLALPVNTRHSFYARRTVSFAESVTIIPSL